MKDDDVVAAAIERVAVFMRRLRLKKRCQEDLTSIGKKIARTHHHRQVRIKVKNHAASSRKPILVPKRGHRVVGAISLVYS